MLEFLSKFILLICRISEKNKNRVYFYSKFVFTSKKLTISQDCNEILHGRSKKEVSIFKNSSILVNDINY